MELNNVRDSLQQKGNSILSSFEKVTKRVHLKDSLPWEIQMLPVDWVQNKSSVRLQNYIKEKEERHDACIGEMKLQMKIVNSDIETKIRIEGEILKTTIKKCPMLVEEHLVTIRFDCANKPIIKTKVFQDAIDGINIVTSDASQKIEAYHAFLEFLEKSRAEKFKNILRESNKKLNEISFKVPNDIKEIFEIEILNINQITLNNFRCYEDLSAKLVAQLENDRRLWIQEYQQFYDLYTLNYDPEDHIVVHVHVDKVGLMRAELKLWAENIAKPLLNFDASIKGVMEANELLILKLYNKQFEEIQNISCKPFCIDYPESEMLDLRDEIFESLFENSWTKQVTPYTSYMKDKWEFSLTRVQEEVQKSFIFLNSAVKLWDKHFIRIFKIKDITLKDFKKLLDKQTEIEHVEIYGFNILLDELREAPTEDILKDTMREIKKSLDMMHKLYETHMEEDKKLLEKYRDLADLESDILLSELQQFLYMFPKSEDIDPTLQRGRRSRIELPEYEEVPRKITMTENSIIALHNWAFGFIDQLEMAAENCNTTCMDAADVWINSQCAIIQYSFTFKMGLHTPRYEKIKATVYGPRLIELRNHNQRWLMHKAGIDNEIHKLGILNQNSKYDNVITEYKTAIEKSSNLINNTAKSCQLQALMSNLKYVRGIQINKIESIRNSYLEACHSNLNEIKSTNVDYVCNMKLFGLGGNYHSEELKNFKVEFTKLDKSLGKLLAPVLKEIQHKHSEALHVINTLEKVASASMQQRYDEMIFCEFVQLEINKLQMSIKYAVNFLKSQFGIIQSCFDELKSGDMHVGNMDYIEDFHEHALNIVDACTVVQTLLHQTTLCNINHKIFKKTSSDGFVKQDEVKSNIAEMAQAPPIDLRAILLEKGPPDELDFMSKIFQLLCQSFDIVQQKAMVFYATNKKFVFQNVTTLNDFVADLLAKYLYYQLQCEEVWLHQAIEYIMLVDEMMNYINNFYISSIVTYNDKQLNSLNREFKEYWTDTNNKCGDIDRCYKSIHNRLKPLHGYPGNEALLNALNLEMEEMAIISANVQNELSDHSESLKEKLNNKCVIYESMIKKIDDEVKTSVDFFISKVINDYEFMNQLHDRIDYLQNLLCVNSHSDESASDFVTVLERQIIKYKRGLEISNQHLLKFSSSLCNMQVASIQSIQSAQFQTADENQFYNSFSNIDFTETYKYKVAELVTQIEYTELTMVNNVVNKWMEFWQNDVEKIKLIYTVKYEKLPKINVASDDDNDETQTLY